jgi:hypothetical protein
MGLLNVMDVRVTGFLEINYPYLPTFNNRVWQYRVGSTTVCPVHNFPPPCELLVCYQAHTGRKSCQVKRLCM